ncbi:MAG: S1 family peptidase [Turicibacter sp.]|nr:S1 family peptidase [Turicibacter sp.]
MKKLKIFLITMFTIALMLNPNIIYATDGTLEWTSSLQNDSMGLKINECSEYLNHLMIEEMGYEFFYNHMKALDTINFLYELLPTNRLGETMYPENFGGMYIDEDGHLVFLLLDNIDNDITLSRLSNNVIEKPADFSYNEIMLTHGYLSYLFEYHYENPVIENIGALWTDIVNNRVVIELFEYNTEMIHIFKNEILDVELLYFTPFEKDITALEFHNDVEGKTLDSRVESATFSPLNTITITPGDTIRMGSPNGGTCSVGFRVAGGFMTAAHCGNIGTRIYNSRGSFIGTMRGRTANIDAGWVSINSNVSVSGTISSTTHISPQVIAPVVGRFVTSRGAINGSRGGTIDRVNVDFTFSQPTNGISRVIGTTRANFRSDGGDSGGIVISHISGQSHGVQGISIARSGTTVSFYTPANRITAWRPQ